MQRIAWTWSGLAGLMLAAAPAGADEVADFYKGRTITVTAASGVGGGYGLYAQLIGEHLAKYIPGSPNVIVNFNPAASGLAAVEHSYNIAPKDGTAVLAPLQSMPTLQAIGMGGGRFDAAKFNWIGRAAETTSAFVVRSKVAGSPEAMLGRGEETVVGITHPGAPNHLLPALLRFCPGVRMKLVSGYPGSAPLALAMQRNEVEGVALPLDSLRTVYPDLLKETVVAQSGLKRARDFAQVPLATDLCKDTAKLRIVEFFQVQEEVGRSYALPPGTPPARVAALRTAFQAVLKDPAVLATAKARRMDINPMTGSDLQQLIERHIGTDAATIAAAKHAVGLQ